MANQYCNKEEVKQLLPPTMSIEGENPSPNYRDPSPEHISNIDLDFFIKLACGNIDGRLATQYDTPLKRTNIDGDIVYPHPIPTIAAIWAASAIYSKFLQGADRQYSEAQKQREEWAEKTITELQYGNSRLLGQRNTRGSRFVRAGLKGTPKNPNQNNNDR